MSNQAVYIRNADKDKFGPQSYSGASGVLLTRFLGRRGLATERGVPLFYRNGTYVGNLGYPKGQPRPIRGRKWCMMCGKWVKGDRCKCGAVTMSTEFIKAYQALRR